MLHLDNADLESPTLENMGNAAGPKSALRKALRHRRRSLSPQQQKIASQGLCKQLARLPAFINSRRIAAYIPNDGEISPQALLELAWRMGKQVYLPVLHPFKTGQLLFMAHTPNQTLAKNRYGIPEPICDEDSRCRVWTLDLVLTPLVGFDSRGHRMGMGGGFYDRTFAYLNQPTGHRKPTLIGVAHQCQKVDELPSESWDIAMSRIVTDRENYIGA